MKRIFTTLVLLAFLSPLFAQRDMEKMLGGYVNPEELVTFSESMPFDLAVNALSRISEKFTGKSILSTAENSAPIGLLIEKMQYKKALNLIVQYADLQYEEGENSIVIKKKGAQVERKLETYAPVDAREVKISAVFFEADVATMKERGVDWTWLLSNSKQGVIIGSDLRSKSQSQQQTGGTKSNIQEGEIVKPEQGSGGSSGGGQGGGQSLPAAWELGAGYTKKFGDFTLNAIGIFNFFETENLGEIIASPSITVRDKQPGRIQIGSDFSVKQRDFAGNTTEKFFSTGSIVEVTPYYYNEDNVDYILLQLLVERSSAIPSEITTEIKKNTAQTQVLMLNGEETVIGGLYVNEEVTVRTGIPFLRDLPWWVLGIRYLTGSDQKQVRKKEVIILIKADLLPTLKERINTAKGVNKLEKQSKQNDESIKFYKFNQAEENKKSK